MLGVAPAIICSALIFGLVHANLVQFLYAAVLGCLLAFLYEKTGFFYVPVLGHIAANTVSVVREAVLWLYDGCERNWIYGSDACGGWRCDMGVLEVEEECGI